MKNTYRNIHLDLISAPSQGNLIGSSWGLDGASSSIASPMVSSGGMQKLLYRKWH